MGAAAIPVAALALTAIGTGVAAYGQYQAGVAAKQQANYQSKVAENNAILAQRSADDARSRGAVAERQSRLRTLQAIGSQRAGAAARGVLVDTGSALDITADTAAIGELDALTIRSNFEREALGYEAQGTQFTSEAALRKSAGVNAQAQGGFEAGGTLLSGGGVVADRWYRFRSGYDPYYSRTDV